MYIYNAEVTINEISLGAPAIPHLPDVQRLESLWTSLQATKPWLDIWIELKPEQYLQVSSVVFFQFIRIIVNLYKLSVQEDPVWNQSAVRETVNVLEYLDRNIAKLKTSPDYLIFEEGKDMNIA